MRGRERPTCRCFAVRRQSNGAALERSTGKFPKAHFDVATGSSCSSLLQNTNRPAEHCRELMRQVFDRTLPDRRERTVVLASIWDIADIPGLDVTLKRLSDLGLRVYVLGPSTYYDQALPILLYRAERSGDPNLPARHLVYPPQYFDVLETAMPHTARCVPGRHSGECTVACRRRVEYTSL